MTTLGACSANNSAPGQASGGTGASAGSAPGHSDAASGGTSAPKSGASATGRAGMSANNGAAGAGAGHTGIGNASAANAGANAGDHAGTAGEGGAHGGAAGASAAMFRCPPGPYGQPVPSGATPQRIEAVPPLDAFNDMGRTRTNIEGAAWIGNVLYVSEFPFDPAPTSRVLAISPDGSGSSTNVSVAIGSCGANGMAVDAAGNLIATDHQHGAVVRYAFPLGTPTTIVASYGGKRFNSPNDLAVRSDGNIYFSDPDYQAPSMHPQTQTRLYRVPPGSSEARVIDATRAEPNGVTLSIDERTLYVSGSDGILAYPVKDDGDVAAGSGVRVAAFSGSSDGLTIDCAGNLYATSGKRVAVLSPAGAEIASIPVSGAENVTNLAFGGPEHKTLFITSMGTGDQRGVFHVELAVPGMPY